MSYLRTIKKGGVVWDQARHHAPAIIHLSHGTTWMSQKRRVMGIFHLVQVRSGSAAASPFLFPCEPNVRNPEGDESAGTRGARRIEDKNPGPHSWVSSLVPSLTWREFWWSSRAEAPPFLLVSTRDSGGCLSWKQRRLLLSTSLRLC